MSEEDRLIELEIMKKRAVREYKKQLRSKIEMLLSIIAILVVFVGGTVYNLIIL